MSNFIPDRVADVIVEDMKRIFEKYKSILPDSLDTCMIEFYRWQRKWNSIPKQDCPSSVVEALKSCNSDLYPNIYILLKVFASIPVTSATAERSFSKLRQVKTYLRSTMSEARLTGLTLLAIHKDIPLDYDSVIDLYKTEHNSRFKL